MDKIYNLILDLKDIQKLYTLGSEEHSKIETLISDLHFIIKLQPQHEQRN